MLLAFHLLSSSAPLVPHDGHWLPDLVIQIAGGTLGIASAILAAVWAYRYEGIKRK